MAQEVLERARGEFRTDLLSGALTYDPTRGCYSPRRPMTNDRFSREQFISDAERYVSCLRSNAEADVLFARGAIERGYRTKVNEFQRELSISY